MEDQEKVRRNRRHSRLIAIAATTVAGITCASTWHAWVNPSLISVLTAALTGIGTIVVAALFTWTRKMETHAATCHNVVQSLREHYRIPD